LVLTAQCESELPSSDLFRYCAELYIAGQSFPIDVNQLLLKGSNLRNTDWCIAFVAFTGNDTKLMKNSKEGPAKLSAVERQLNIFVYWILVL